MMSEEAEPRVCDEISDSEEGNTEPYHEEGESSRELPERLRELEAENSALALANESQREAYERCLDEVANHVVQALLNQKDLREECIKLKMRVFDLERQNRTLSELLHQKIHSQTILPQQMPPGPLLEHCTEPLSIDSDRPLESQCETQAKSTGESTEEPLNRSPKAAISMEALSPFFKKKAHILEVLRRLEETDPLKFQPTGSISSCCHFGQNLVLAETTIVPQSHCRHSCSDFDMQEYTNGDDHNLDYERCHSCLILSQKNLDGLCKCHHVSNTSHPGRMKNLNSLGWLEAQCTSSQNTGLQASDDSTNKVCLHSIFPEESGLPTQQSHEKPSIELPQPVDHDTYVYTLIKDISQNGLASHEPEEVQSGSPHEEICCDKLSRTIVPAECTSTPRVADSLLPDKNLKHTETMAMKSLGTEKALGIEECYFKVTSEAASVKNSLYPTTSNMPVPGLTDSPQLTCCAQEAREQMCNGLYLSSSENTQSKIVPVSENKSTSQETSPGKSKLAFSPSSPSSLTEAKASPISSPSRLLRFLKIPSIGERAHASSSLHLSPQLTRSSKIPCRNNNYEVYHSPVTARKATTTEREKQPPSFKTDSYPITHSAPTSPPKPEDACLPVAKELINNSHSAPKANRSAKLAIASQAPRVFEEVPHYENVSKISSHGPVEGSVQFLEKPNMSHSPPYPSKSPSEKQLPPSKDKLLSPNFKQHNLLPATKSSLDLESSEKDTYTERTVWHEVHNHHSLPNSSAFHKTQNRCIYSSMKDGQHDGEVPDIASENCDHIQALIGENREDPLSVSKRLAVGKPSGESSHLPFKERLAALGKLRSAEDLQVGVHVDRRDGQSSKAMVIRNNEKSRTAERQGDRTAIEPRHSKYTGSLDGKPYPKTGLAGYALKFPAQCLPCEPEAKSLPSSSSVKSELDSFSSRVYVAKAEGSKTKMGMPSSSPDPQHVLRNYMKCTTSHNGKTAPGPQGSPTKVPSKSPSKLSQISSNPRGTKPIQDDRCSAHKYSSKSEDRSKLIANKKKNSIYSESLPSPPPRPADVSEDKRTFVPGPRSAIEQKVMKGIEENVLKLQGQDRGQTAEVKQKASNGIASWFGLKKSKLPALSRKPEMSKPKDDKKEWKLSSLGKDPKSVTKKNLEMESLNISKLMEKAEDLRKALEEERAYVNGVALDRPARGHSCEVVMDQAQGQLSVMYRGVASDTFMQQLLNRVDKRDTTGFGLAHRRLSFDSKKSRPSFSHQKNGIISHTKSSEQMEKGSELVSKDDVTSDESLAESIKSQHFGGASTHTLDSGIGTFPLPDYTSSAAGKSVPKVKLWGEHECSSPHGKSGPMTKVSRKVRTLERELSSLEEDALIENDLNPSALYSSALDCKGSSVHLSSTIHGDDDAFGAHMRSLPSKNWTFPNLKASTGPAEVYLGVREEVEPATYGAPFRQNLKPCGALAPHEADSPGMPLPLQPGRRGKVPAPSAPEVSKDVGLELVKGPQDDVLSPSQPQVLETLESLSDSLYDSLSSCGSQG